MKNVKETSITRIETQVEKTNNKTFKFASSESEENLEMCYKEMGKHNRKTFCCNKQTDRRDLLRCYSPNYTMNNRKLQNCSEIGH